jgi:hypothetical protein
MVLDPLIIQHFSACEILDECVQNPFAVHRCVIIIYCLIFSCINLYYLKICRVEWS